MIPKTYIYSFFIFLSLIFAEAQTGRQNRGAASDEKQYLFPGTGFFVKNRLPYDEEEAKAWFKDCLLYTSPSPRDLSTSRMPSSA